ncbi:cytochrome P450 4F2-like [Littorina saxatilis]|uniref:Cytochrome P450 n=1 Tax=Littorina saxatilis TaxID=31220 RepID=A0AAN9BPD6_9CAEN
MADNLSTVAAAALVVVVTTVVVKVVRWLLWYRSYFLFFNSLPGDTDFSWIWGNVHKFRQLGSDVERLQYFDKLTEQFPQFYRVWLGPLRVQISLNHPDTVKPLLKTAEPKGWTYDFAKPWLGEGLLVSGGSRWRRSRRLLTPAFHFDILKPYEAIGNRACDVMLANIAKCAAEKKSLEMFSSISVCTLDVILQCAMSYTDDVQTKGESHPYVQATATLTSLLKERISNPLVHWDWAWALTANGKKNAELCNYVHRVSEEVISARQKDLEQEGPPKKRYLDFLDVLLTARDDTGQGLSPQDIRSEVDTFMFEGHDTTASGVSWTMYSLCQHPDVQCKVQREIDTVLQGRESDDILWDDLPKLDYLTMVIKEAMRLHCPVPVVSRSLTEPLTIAGTTLPPGTMCTINIYNVHHNPTVWDDPHAFLPGRFLPDNVKERDAYAFIPFSAGPRNCIGQHFAMNEQKIMIGRLLRRFTFSLDPSHKVEKKMATVMRTETGMKMFATPRTPSP